MCPGASGAWSCSSATSLLWHTLLKGGCAQWADQCRADGDCRHAARSSVGVGAEEPWGMWDLALAQK